PYPLREILGRGTKFTLTREPGDLPCVMKPTVGDDGTKETTHDC
ncbi:MAG: hypothetical protein ACI901_001090, partial [Octadecabacter sp.]